MEPRLFRRIARDNTTLGLLAVLALIAVFVIWQAARLWLEDGAPTHVTSMVAASRSVKDTVSSLEDTPVSRPHLALQRFTTANGARVLFAPAPEVPMVEVRVVFDGGGARDGGLAGLARFTSAMIGEGTPKHTADQFNVGFESVGAQFSASSYRDMAIVNLRSLTRPELLEPALALFIDALANPDFPRDAVERIRDQMLVGLKRDEEEPGTIASRSYMAALYLAHPYAMPADGTVDTVHAIRVEDLRAFHQRYYVARNAVIAIAGAVNRAEAGFIADSISAALEPGNAAPPLPPPPDPTGNQFHVKADTRQTHLLIGLPAIKRNDPDEAALLVANEILGGSAMSSLLGSEIREKRGLAYAVGSGFQPMRAAGPFTIRLQTRNDAAGEALGVALDTLRKFVAEGPTQAQLEDARKQLVGGYPLQLAGNNAIVGTLAMIGFYGLPDDYLERQLAQIETLDTVTLRDAFRRHVPLDRLMIVSLGPQKPEAKTRAAPIDLSASDKLPDGGAPANARP